MLKYFIFSFVMMFCANADAAWGPKFGSGDSCIVERKNSKRQFHFCGKSQDSCAGKDVKKKSKEWTHEHTGTFTSAYDSTRKFFCCNKNNDDKGVWKEGNAWYTSDTIEKKELPNGTCNYRKRITICGDDDSTTCDTPDTCKAGTILRNNECIAPCKANQAFASASDNTCIECQTTNYQGPAENNICIKCDSKNQFFNTKTKKCISKDTMKTYSANTMKQCHGCPNKDFFKQCVELLSKSSDMRNTSEYKKIASQCHLDNAK